MKDKVLLRVLLIATERTYDFRVPFDLRMEEATSLITKMLSTYAGGLYEPQGDEELMLVDGPDAGMLLDGDISMRSLVARGVVTNGTTVALV